MKRNETKDEKIKHIRNTIIIFDFIYIANPNKTRASTEAIMPNRTSFFFISFY